MGDPPPGPLTRRGANPRVVPNLPFVTVNKRNQFEAPLSSSSVIYSICPLFRCFGRGVAAGAGNLPRGLRTPLGLR